MKPEQIAWSYPKPSNLSQESIYSIARSMAREMEFNPGDSIRRVLKDLGGTCETSDSLDRCGSAMIVFGERNFIASVCPYSTPLHDRVRLTQHIAHYLLHYLWQKRQNSDDTLIRVPHYVTDRAKWEAVWFASEFLMPECHFKKMCSSCHSDPLCLSDIFRVPIWMITARMQHLGLETH